MNMKLKNQLPIFIAIIVMIQGCVNSQEQLEKMNKMTAIVKSSCSCDDIGLSMTNTNGYDAINYKLVGCEFNSVDSLADNLIMKMKEQIPNICETNEINFVFINKGEGKAVCYKKCEKITKK
jgi:hypothetical protein